MVPLTLTGPVPRTARAPLITLHGHATQRSSLWIFFTSQCKRSVYLCRRVFPEISFTSLECDFGWFLTATENTKFHNTFTRTKRAVTSHVIWLANSSSSETFQTMYADQNLPTRVRTERYSKPKSWPDWSEYSPCTVADIDLVSTWLRTRKRRHEYVKLIRFYWSKASTPSLLFTPRSRLCQNQTLSNLRNKHRKQYQQPWYRMHTIWTYSLWRF
jgi:hypothetical protein